MLLFVDESGQDRTLMPYEVLAGVLIAEENLWNLVKAVRAAEKEHFGDYFRHLRVTEVKAKELLKKRYSILPISEFLLPRKNCRRWQILSCVKVSSPVKKGYPTVAQRQRK
jgi:hypothetical protein